MLTLATSHLNHICLLYLSHVKHSSHRTETRALIISWAHAPKKEYVTRSTVEIATAQAVLVFNSGSQALIPIMERLGAHPGQLCSLCRSVMEKFGHAYDMYSRISNFPFRFYEVKHFFSAKGPYPRQTWTYVTSGMREALLHLWISIACSSLDQIYWQRGDHQSFWTPSKN